MARERLREVLGLESPATAAETDQQLVESLLGQTASEAGISLEEFRDAPPERQKLIIEQVHSKVATSETDDVAEDYYKARNNMSTLLDIIMQAVNTAAQVATQTEHPRAFDSLNSLANTARSVAMDVLNIQRKLAEIRNPSSGGGVAIITPANQNPFQGAMTTKSIMELMRKEAGPLQALASGSSSQFQPRPLDGVETVPVEVPNGKVNAAK